jgi:Ca-activated chloride channel homolog
MRKAKRGTAACWAQFFLLGFVLIAAGQVAWAEPGLPTVLENRQGIKDLTEGKPSEAQQKFLQGLAENPLEARLHYNLGLSFEVIGQPDKAAASYQTALKLADDPNTKFSANFNLGEMAQKAKKKDEALAYYQEALKYNPDSVETKTNIEMLTQENQGQGEGEDKKEDQDNQDGKGKGDQSKDPKEGDQDEKKKDQQQGKDDKPKEYAKNKPQPKKFKSEQLTQGDVNKILGEIKQQEQKIRAEFNKKETKEEPREKDW